MTATPEATAQGGFADLGLDARLLAALQDLGYEEPTPIQRAAIPRLLAGHDLIGQAATGTGKTAAFALPLLQGAEAGADGQGPQALILVPTRELAMQVAEALHRYGRAIGITTLPVYGGQAIAHQLRALRRGVDVVVATPGRALDHLKRGSLVLDGVRTVVLDEADEMLDMGFAEDLEAILEATPPSRQTVLFSATLPARIKALAKRHLRDPETIEIGREAAQKGEGPRVPQTAYVVPRGHKTAALGRILDMESPTAAILFCRTRHEVDEVAEALNGRGYRAEALHGGLSQEQRDRVMRRFREGAADLLVATDLAARGLDIEHVSHVINFDVPSDPDGYVHRIGRTGRAGRVGAAITLVAPREHRLLRNIEHATGQTITVATVPTVADLRMRRMQLTRQALEEALVEGDHEVFRVIVEALSETYDVMDVAAAAVGLAHQAISDGQEAEEIPAVGTGWRDGADRDGRGRAPREGGERRARREFPPPAWDVARLHISAGRQAGIRPGDLVGAIANEAGLSSRFIGAIKITDNFSLVEVPEEHAEGVIAALSRATVRGRKVTVKRDTR